MNTMRSYVSQIFNDIESHNVCSVLCARAQAHSSIKFVEQVPQLLDVVQSSVN